MFSTIAFSLSFLLMISLSWLIFSIILRIQNSSFCLVIKETKKSLNLEQVNKISVVICPTKAYHECSSDLSFN